MGPLFNNEDKLPRVELHQLGPNDNRKECSCKDCKSLMIRAKSINKGKFKRFISSFKTQKLSEEEKAFLIKPFN
jgi:hypothetical protein